MIFRLSFVLIVIVWFLPVYGTEPTNAIDWLMPTENRKNEVKSHSAYPDKTESVDLIITKSELRPNDLNNVGIIPAKIAGIDPKIWQEMNELTLFLELQSLPDLNFDAAQTFLKRILISETIPPIPNLENKLAGKLYLIAKLDKLIEIGALEEAETIITQVRAIDRKLFERLATISFLTGRIDNMCYQLSLYPGLNDDLTVKIICLANLNDWNAAALILSSAVSLNLLDSRRELLLINYLDPSFLTQNNLFENQTNFDELDFYLGNVAKNPQLEFLDDVKYRYAIFNNGADLEIKIPAAEALTRKRSINVSTLFDTYRNNNISGSGGFWSRMLAIKSLDQALNRNNQQTVGIALNRAIDEMFKRNLLFTMASEYSSKLETFSTLKDRQNLNDSFAIIFALNNEIPGKWSTYQSKNRYISMAINVLKNNTLNASLIGDAIRLVNPTFNQSKDNSLSNKPNQNELSNLKESKMNKGALILQVLKKTSKGVNTQSSDLYESLLSLINIGQVKLAKSILVEYLVYHSRSRA